MLDRFRRKLQRCWRRPRRRRRPVILPILIIALILLVIRAATVQFRPVLTKVALAEVSDIVTATVNNAVSEEMEAGKLEYNDLVKLEKSSEGRVTALITDMNRINTLQADITNRVIAKLSSGTQPVIKIPFGNLTGKTFLSGMGPRIPVKIVSVSNVSTAFRNDFSSEGINQTRHQIMLDVEVSLTILIPGGTQYTTVKTELAVAETIIVGDVPDSYSNITPDLFGGL